MFESKVYLQQVCKEVENSNNCYNHLNNFENGVAQYHSLMTVLLVMILLFIGFYVGFERQADEEKRKKD